MSKDSPHHQMAGDETVTDAKRPNSPFPVLPINNLTLGVLMSAWIFVIGLVLLWADMVARPKCHHRCCSRLEPTREFGRGFTKLGIK